MPEVLSKKIIIDEVIFIKIKILLSKYSVYSLEDHYIKQSINFYVGQSKKQNI